MLLFKGIMSDIRLSEEKSTRSLFFQKILAQVSYPLIKRQPKSEIILSDLSMRGREIWTKD